MAPRHLQRLDRCFILQPTTTAAVHQQQLTLSQQQQLRSSTTAHNSCSQHRTRQQRRYFGPIEPPTRGQQLQASNNNHQLFLNFKTLSNEQLPSQHHQTLQKASSHQTLQHPSLTRPPTRLQHLVDASKTSASSTSHCAAAEHSRVIQPGSKTAGTRPQRDPIIISSPTATQLPVDVVKADEICSSGVM